MTIIMSSLISEVKTGDTDGVERILRQSDVNDTINYQDADRRETALFCACARGFLTIVQLLLSFKARLDLYTIWGGTPLHAAAENGHENIVRLLLQHRAKIDAQTHYGDTALHLAAFRGHFNVVKILVEAGAATAVRNVKYNRPIEEAGIHGHSLIGNYLSDFEKRKERTSSASSAPVPCVPVSVECYTPMPHPTYTASQPSRYGNGERLFAEVNDLSKDQVDWSPHVGFNSNIPIADGIQRWQGPPGRAVYVADGVPSRNDFFNNDNLVTDGVPRRQAVECEEPVADRFHRRREPVESLDPTAVVSPPPAFNHPDKMGNALNNTSFAEDGRRATVHLMRCREELAGIQTNLQQTRDELEGCRSIQQHTLDKEKYINDKVMRLTIRERDLMLRIRQLEIGQSHGN